MGLRARDYQDIMGFSKGTILRHESEKLRYHLEN